MNSFINIVRSNMLVQAIVFIVLGLFVLLWPGITVTTIVYLFGAIFALSGIASLVNYGRRSSQSYKSPAVLTSGIFMCVLALIVFIFPQAVASLFSLILGIVLVLCGVVSAVRSFDMRGFGGSSWIVSLVMGAVVAVGGIVIIANPFETTLMFIYVLGALMVINGVADLIIEWRSRSEIKAMNSHA